MKTAQHLGDTSSVEDPEPITSSRSRGFRHSLGSTSGFWADDDLSKIREQFAKWCKLRDHNLELFQKHLHSNPEPGAVDFAQHRILLHHMLATGESLLLDLIKVKHDGEEFERLFAEISNAIQPIEVEFFLWHTPIAIDSTLPVSTKSGFADLDRLAVKEW